MAVTRYQPTTELFGPFFEELLSRPLAEGGRMRNLLRAPEADVLESEKDIRVVMDAPGMRPDDIDISLENNLLTVSGERRAEWQDSEEERFSWHLSERRYGKFTRSFVLPRDVDADNIRARVDNGVLSIYIPKSEKARRRRIEIQDDGQGRHLGTTAA